MDVPDNWLHGWNCRKSHVINSAPEAGINYQVRIEACYSNGTDGGDTVFLSGETRTDFGDMRVTSSDGVTELDYWIETVNDGVNATLWIEIAGNLTDQSQIIYLYFNNSNATTTSDGEHTFMFFDDFSGNLSKWTKHENGDNIYIESGYLVCEGGYNSTPYGHTVLGSNATYATFEDGVIEADVYPLEEALPEIGFRGVYSANTGYKGRWGCRTDYEEPWMKPPYDGWEGFGDPVERFGIANQWQRVRLAIYGSTFRIYSDGVLKSTVTDTEYAGPGEISLQNHYGLFSRFDDVRVRKYVEPEPTHGDWGMEEVHGS